MNPICAIPFILCSAHSVTSFICICSLVAASKLVHIGICLASDSSSKNTLLLRNMHVIVFGLQFFLFIFEICWKIKPKNSGFIVQRATRVFRRGSTVQKHLVERYGLALIREPTVNGELHFLTSKTFQVFCSNIKYFSKSLKKLNFVNLHSSGKKLARWLATFMELVMWWECLVTRISGTILKVLFHKKTQVMSTNRVSAFGKHRTKGSQFWWKHQNLNNKLPSGWPTMNTKKAHLVTELVIIPNRGEVLMLND